MSGKIYITYSRKEPDVSIANRLCDILKSKGYSPFLAPKNIDIDVNWQETMNSELAGCDVFVVLLSERSLMSDMITEEVRTAKQLNDSRNSKIRIMPVRVNLPHNITINYDIKNYLREVNQFLWTSLDDESTVFKQMIQAVESGQNDTDNRDTPADESEVIKSELPVPNAPLEFPGGTIKLDSTYYIERKGEEGFKHEIVKEGALLRIKGPRQFGKTSLLSRIIHLAGQNNHAVVPLSFQQISTNKIEDLDRLLIQLCVHATRKLGLSNRIKEFWDDEFMDIKMKCTAYFEEYLLPESQKPVVLALDEADRVFEFSEVSAEFFSMLRFWHEERNINPLWNNLKLAVSHSTEAYLAIDKMNQSPFNIGIERELVEFDAEQVSDFAIRHGLKFSDKQIGKLMEMIGGHPYLTHKALYVIATGEYTFREFLKKAPTDDGPFSDHLRRHHWNLSKNPVFKQAMKAVAQNNAYDNVLVCNKLRAAGLIKGTTPEVSPSFKLYQIYFGRKL